MRVEVRVAMRGSTQRIDHRCDVSDERSPAAGTGVSESHVERYKGRLTGHVEGKELVAGGASQVRVALEPLHRGRRDRVQRERVEAEVEEAL